MLFLFAINFLKLKTSLYESESLKLSEEMLHCYAFMLGRLLPEAFTSFEQQVSKTLSPDGRLKFKINNIPPEQLVEE